MNFWQGTLVLCLVAGVVLLAGFASKSGSQSPGQRHAEDVQRVPHTKRGEHEGGTMEGRQGRQYQPGALIGIVESEEHAQEIAELYGITVVTVGYEFALFHTEEDVMDVIDRGIQNGWPPLEPNWIKHMNAPR